MHAGVPGHTEHPVIDALVQKCKLQEEIILKLQEAVGSGALEKPNEELLQVC
jgi:hypothetical protein